MKRCTRCQEEKPLDAFKQDPRYLDGRTSWCKACRYKRKQQRWRQLHPETCALYDERHMLLKLGLKRCRKCKSVKSRERFVQGGRKRGGSGSDCHACASAWQSTYRELHPKRKMLTGAKKRARELGRDFNITIDDFEIPDRCPLLGIELKRSDTKVSDASPSLDRIDSTKGYVRGNVWVISWRANSIKRDASLEELESIVLGLRCRTAS